VGEERQPDRQRAFYAGGEHAHLQVQEDDRYAAKLAAELVRRSGLRPTHRVLEVGAGFGRFSFPLLEHCGSLVALDLSARALADLERMREARGVAEERCQTQCADATSFEPDAGAQPFDRIVGFFILHHLPDVLGALNNLARLLAPGGSMVFLEPNRRNPLFVLQVLACPDMSWREEKGMFLLSPAAVQTALRESGLAPLEIETLGFFPPQLYNRFEWARRFEARLERSRALQPVLPFRLFRGTGRP
jgi:SAM-dependent methyltransferase